MGQLGLLTYLKCLGFSAFLLSCSTYVRVSDPKQAKDNSIFSFASTPSYALLSVCTEAPLVIKANLKIVDVKTITAKIASDNQAAVFSDPACTTALSDFTVDISTSTINAYILSQTLGTTNLTLTYKDHVVAQTSVEVKSQAPTAVTLTADTLIAYTAIDSSSSLSIASGPYPITNAIAAPAAAPVMTTISAVVDQSAAPIAAPAYANGVTSPPTQNLYLTASQYAVNLTTTATYPDYVKDANKSCAFNSPYASLTCAFGIKSFLNSDFTSNSISLKAMAKTESSTTVSSTQIASRKYRLKKVVDFGAVTTAFRLFKAANGVVYFQAKNPAGFTKLYGITGNTFIQVTDNVAGGNDSPVSPTELNGKLYFIASATAAETNRLFSFDGTTLRQLTGFNVGASDAASIMGTCGNFLFFKSKDAANKTRVFSFDGTNMYQLSNVLVGGDSANTGNNNACYNGRYYFSLSNINSVQKFASSNGTDLTEYDVAGAALGDVNSTNSLMGVPNGRTYFVVRVDAVPNLKIYSTNGTDLIKQTDLFVGGSDSPSSTFDVCDSKIFFYAQISGGVYKEFALNSSGQISQIIDAKGPATSDGPFGLACLNGSYYFSANLPGSGSKLFKYANGVTTQVASLNAASDAPSLLSINLPNYLLIQMTDTDGVTRYFTIANDGTIRRLASYTGAGGPFTNANSTSKVFDNKLFYSLNDATNKVKLHATDGANLFQFGNVSQTGEHNLDYAGACASERSGETDGKSLFIPLYHAITGCIDKLYRVCIDTDADCT